VSQATYITNQDRFASLSVGMFLAIGIVAVVTTAAAASGSTLIGQGTENFNMGQPHINDTGNFMYGVAEEVFEDAFVLFDLPEIDASVLGMTYTANADNTTDWDGAVNLLTNGENNGMWSFSQITGAQGSIQSWSAQSLVFFPFEPGGGPDFAGYAIDYIELEFLTFSIVSPGPDPLGDGNWTHWTTTYRISIYGEVVPSPAAVLPLFALAAARRRRRRD
jgi:hypothetical protein